MPYRIALLPVVLCGALLAPALRSAQGEPAPELKPRTATINDKEIRVENALAALKQQTGMEVIDRRANKAAKPLALALKEATFWQALDEIASAAGARASLYQPDGKLALVDGPAPRGKRERSPVSYHGLFRTTVRQVTAARDFDNDTHTYSVRLELAWEPRLQPFLVDVGAATVLEMKKKDVPGQGQVSVTGKLAAEAVIRLPEAPQRATASLGGLDGKFTVTAPTKMLDFTFAKLREIKPRGKSDVLKQEGVRVSLTEVTKQKDVWTVEVTVDNPPGAPRFESYQSWLGNNTIALEKGAGKAKVRLLADAEEEIISLSAQQAVVRYRFTRKANPGVPFGELGDWSLVYRTPGRMVEITVPYSFRNVPLP